VFLYLSLISLSASYLVALPACLTVSYQTFDHAKHLCILLTHLASTCDSTSISYLWWQIKKKNLL